VTPTIYFRCEEATMSSSQRTVAAAIDVDDATVDGFRSSLRGELITPVDPSYDTIRAVWNGMIDKRPALIARCTGVADVIASVNFARQQNMLVSIRGGGHNVAGNAVCDGGLMIDLSQMKGIWVDPTQQTARAQGGVLWGEFDHETQQFGLATTGGTISTTGIAGLTLGGGVGWLNGKYGLACDNLISVDIVTADGELRRASATENEELFWGVRGAGANFGVVTSFEFKLHPVGPMILGGMVLHPIDRAAEVLRFYREFTASEPDELTTSVAMLTGPDGNRVIALVACYAGSIDEGERILAPLRLFGSPIADMMGPLPYTALQSLLDAAFPHGQHSYWKSSMMRSIDDEAIGIMTEHFASVPSSKTVVLIEHYHGAYARVTPTDTAFNHRADPHNFVTISVWDDPAETERNVQWTRDLYEAIDPYLSRGVYVNVLDSDEGFARVKAAYGENYDRLLALKRQYDPMNLFRMNHNIRPD
jgi:FAD/FMN-containing dehydrogenase